MTAYFLKNLTQLRVYWTTEWKNNVTVKLKVIMDQGSMDPHFGPWTTFMDRVHAPPVTDRVHGHLFLNNEKWTKTEIVQK